MLGRKQLLYSMAAVAVAMWLRDFIETDCAFCGRSHTLPPSDIYLAHLMPFLEKQAAEMNTRLSDTQQANTELLSTVTAQRAEIESLVHGLENVIQDLEASAQMMGQDEVQDLGKEIKELETEMKK